MSLVSHDSNEENVVSFISKITVCWQETGEIRTLMSQCGPVILCDYKTGLRPSKSAVLILIL